MTRIPPQALEAEQSVLGTVMLRPEVAALVVSELSPEHFYAPRNADIFSVIADLFSTGQPCDMVTILHRLSGKVDSSYVAGLTDIIPFPVSIPSHCRIIREKYKARKAIDLASNVLAKCYDSDNIKEVVDDFGHGFSAIMDDKSNKAHHVGAIAMAEMERMSEAQRNGHVDGLPTGFSALDNRWVGLAKTDLVIIAARPSMGKTCLAMNLAANVAEQGRKVMVFSLEMGKSAITRRMISAYSGVGSDAMRKGYISSEGWQSVNRAVGSINALPMMIDDQAGLSITELQARAKNEHLKGKLSLVVVDYIQLMSAKAGNREQEISAISRGLKGLAKDLDIPVIALSQLNRSLESRPDKRPLLSDLRESGAIEQDADLVAFIYREEVYNPGSFSPRRGIAEILTRKQRNGSTGTDELLFQGEFSRFLNLEN